MYYLLKRITIVLLFIISISCFNSKTKHPIKVVESSMQSYSTVEGRNRGTHIEVRIQGKIAEVKILSLVYNQQQITPILELQADEVVIHADFESGIEKLYESPVYVDKDNLIIYTYRGKIYELPLEDIERKKAKYYPVK